MPEWTEPKPRRSAYSPEFDIDLKSLENLGIFPPRIILPHNRLFGLRTPREYSPRRLSIVDAYFSEYKKLNGDYLAERPAMICAVPMPFQDVGIVSDEVLEAGVMYRLAIIDGHHRVRLAPKHDIYHIPVHVLTVQQGLEVYKAIDQQPFSDARGFASQLNEWMSEAFTKFKSLQKKQRKRKATPFDMPVPVVFEQTEPVLQLATQH